MVDTHSNENNGIDDDDDDDDVPFDSRVGLVSGRLHTTATYPKNEGSSARIDREHARRPRERIAGRSRMVLHAKRVAPTCPKIKHTPFYENNQKRERWWYVWS